MQFMIDWDLNPVLFGSSPAISLLCHTVLLNRKSVRASFVVLFIHYFINLV